MVVPLIEESINEHIRLGLREAPPEIPVGELQPLLIRHQRRLEFPRSLSFPDDQEHHLIGGQVSYLLHRKVLAVTYHQQPNQPITLLVLPGAGIWFEGPLIYTLVSDAGEGDLWRLVEKLRHK